MKRRDWLAAVSALGTARSLFGAVAPRPRLSVCAFSCHQHWRAVEQGNGAARFSDTLGFLHYARELGFEGVQCGFRPAGRDQVGEIRALVDAGALFEADLRLPGSETDLATFERSVRAAREAGASVARVVCSGGRRYEVFKTRAEFESFTARAKYSLELAEPILARHRLRLAVENHKDHTAPELSALLKGLSSEWIGVLVDTGNNLALLETPEETIDALAPYVVSVHLKDMALSRDDSGFRLSEVPLGSGVLDLKMLVARLTAANPELVFNLEMATRDPLLVPCRREVYFATFPERRSTHLDRMLAWIDAHPSRGPVHEVSGKPIEKVLVEEENNNRTSLLWMKDAILRTLALFLVFACASAVTAEEAAPQGKGKGKGKGKAKAVAVEPDFLAPLAGKNLIGAEGRQLDFPDLAEAEGGSLWVAYLSHDGKEDTLQLSRVRGESILETRTISQPGILHQPAITVDGSGGAWVFWGQVGSNEVMSLRARRCFEGELGEEVTLAASPSAGNSFADAATDPSGRVWVVWQEVRPGASRVRARHWSPETKSWSNPIVLSERGGGHWEPRITFTPDGTAWVAYDSSEEGEFNLRLASVTGEDQVVDQTLLTTPEYEARASIAADADGKLWITAERGRRQWGLDSRGHENEMGFNAGKRFLLVRFDPADGSVEEVPVPAKGRPTPAPDPSPGFAVNVPSVKVTSDGRIWVSYRYFSNLYWRVALTAYDPVSRLWLEPGAFADSTMGQDRHQELMITEAGELWINWPSDHRRTKAPGFASVHLARIDTQAAWQTMVAEKEVFRSPEPEPYFKAPTPARPLTEHHEWAVGGKTYRLVWGDLHRHTDISNCRTGFDGSVLDAYRYACDIAGLDFLGTSDHTDAVKFYHPYEWWHTQRHVDAFFAPGSFAPLYTYEREQAFPWGHRNLAFAKRGAPVIYNNRSTYRESPWQAIWPVRAGLDPIQPDELWDLLKRIDLPCAVISHTGATGMGTDWTRYENGIDNTYENTVEIFQGARVSYEGLGTPQPTVGLRKEEPYTPSIRDGKNFPMPPAAITDFEAAPNVKSPLNNGVYRKALAEGHRLGVFASSDHIAAHTSFGGVYVEDFTREGIIAGFKARRTCAATDKIFIEFSCGAHAMGEAFATSEKPILTYRVQGTAPIQRITIVRNEEDLRNEVGDRSGFEGNWTDPDPRPGENRYYLRVEQADGNLAWSSPIWIDYRPR